MSRIYNDTLVVGSVALDGSGNDQTSSQWSYAATAGGVSSTADVTLKGAPGLGSFNYLRTVNVSHDALSGATEFVIKSTSTVIYRGKLQASASESSVNLYFDPPLKGLTNSTLFFALLTSVTGGVYVNAQGYSGK